MHKESEELTVSRLISFDQVELIREEWNALHDALMPGSIHSDIDWYCTISRTFASNNSPVVFTFRRKAELVGIIAGYYHVRNVTVKFGYLQLGRLAAPAFSTNYQCCMAQADSDVHDAMAEVLWGELSERRVRLVYVNALQVDDPLYRLLSHTPFSKAMPLAYPPAPHMMMRLAPTLEQTIASKGSSVRAFLRHTISKNSRPESAPNFSFRVYTRPEEIARYFVDAEAVAKKTYQRALNVGFQATAFHKEQVEVASSKGCFRGNILYAGGNPVAFQEDYLCGTHCFNPYVGYDPAFSAHNPGTYLMVKAWEELIKSTKASVYDFGYGEGLYKQRYADICIYEGELLLLAYSVKNLLFFVVLSIGLWTDRWIKHALNSLGIYEKIKKLWRRQKARIVPASTRAAPRPCSNQNTTD